MSSRSEHDDPSTTGFGAPLVAERALARRWYKSLRTLQRWRAEGYGPPFIRIGGTVFYREADIIAFENRMRSGGGCDK